MEDNIDHILSQILSEEATAEEKLAFARWLEENEANKKEFLLLKNYWDKRADQTSVDKNSSWKKLSAKLKDEGVKKQQPITVAMRSPWLKFVSVAAIALIIVTLGFYTTTRTEVVPDPLTYQICEATDKPVDYNLPDGTKVTLNKNSRLKYSDQYGKSLRSVLLEGEALFEVTPNKAVPFVVEMENTSIRVLGTIFNVNTADVDNSIVATLVQGSIQFESPREQVIMAPNQQLIYNKATTDTNLRHVNTDCILMWKTGAYRYKSRSFNEVMSDLQSIYNVEIQVMNPDIKSTLISGTLKDGKTLPEALEIISESLPFKWEQKDNKVIITK